MTGCVMRIAFALLQEAFRAADDVFASGV